MEIAEIGRQNLDRYEALFNLCFPHSNLNSVYLEWLYFSNPLGNAVGFDAMDGDLLAAHYVCIPTRVGDNLGLLSLNTATHPDYQSQGLFQKLAKVTYEKGSQDFSFVIGVGNALSSGVLIKRLGFAEMGRLNLRYGELHRPTTGARTWTEAEVNWRIKSPRQHMKKKEIESGTIELSMRPRNFPFHLKSLIPIQSGRESAPEKFSSKKEFGFTVDWIKDSRPRIQLPEKLKPSPLVMVYQPLKNIDIELNSWSFPDFDAF